MRKLPLRTHRNCYKLFVSSPSARRTVEWKCVHGTVGGMPFGKLFWRQYVLRYRCDRTHFHNSPSRRETKDPETYVYKLSNGSKKGKRKTFSVRTIDRTRDFCGTHTHTHKVFKIIIIISSRSSRGNEIKLSTEILIGEFENISVLGRRPFVSVDLVRVVSLWAVRSVCGGGVWENFSGDDRRLEEFAVRV